MLTANQIRATLHELRGAGATHISSATTRRRLHQAGYKSRTPLRRFRLRDHHIKTARLDWARNHAHWNRANWQQVLFSDESRFKLSMPDGRLHVWRQSGERMRNDCILETDAALN